MDIFKIAKERIDGLNQVPGTEPPPNLICPSCKRYKPKRRQWAMNQEPIICKTCFFRMRLVEKRYAFNADALAIARTIRGWSQQEMADRCGWHQTYQSKLESGTVDTISESTARIIQQVLGDLAGIYDLE